MSSKSELKDSTSLSSNDSNVTMDALVKAVQAEQQGREKADTQGNKRRAIALQLAIAYPDTRSQWAARVGQWHGDDAKLRDACREWSAGILGLTDDDDTAYRRNVIAAFMQSITFASDMIVAGFHDDVRFGPKATFIKGNSKLAHAVWRVTGWNESKSKAIANYSSEMDMAITARSADKAAGRNVSWAQLGDVVRDVAGRKGNGRVAATSVSVAKPVEALRVVSEIAAKANVAAFSNVASRMQSIDTAEDIAALGTVGDSMKEARTILQVAFEKVRDMIRADAAAIVKEHKGDPEAAALVRAAMSGK